MRRVHLLQVPRARAGKVRVLGNVPMEALLRLRVRVLEAFARRRASAADSAQRRSAATSS